MPVLLPWPCSSQREFASWLSASSNGPGLLRGWPLLQTAPGLEVVELKDSTPAKEADAIRAARKPAERLVLLSEEGQQLSSVGLAELSGAGPPNAWLW